MAVTIQTHTTRAAGTLLSSSIYNEDHLRHVTNAQSLDVGLDDTNARIDDMDLETFEAIRDDAQAWAEEDEDVEVEPGAFSSKHHAIKSSDSATAAAVSETNAATSETNAATSETNAATSETNAAASEAKAELWAEEDEDVAVEPGLFSAKHHAAKAAASASNAETAADDAVANHVAEIDPHIQYLQESAAAAVATSGNAADLTGTLSDAQLSANVPLKNQANTFVDEISLTGTDTKFNVGTSGGNTYANTTLVTIDGTTFSEIDFFVSGFHRGAIWASDANVTIKSYTTQDIVLLPGNKVDVAGDLAVNGTITQDGKIVDASTTYDVTKYGAVLDGVTDDTAALVAAAADLRAAGGGTLWFPPGSKCLVSEAAHTGYSQLEERTVLLFNESGLDVEIAGNGTEIILDGNQRDDWGHFALFDNLGLDSKVSVHGLRFRYNNPAFVTGTVSAISAGSHIDFDLDSTPSFPDVKRVFRFENKLWEATVLNANANTPSLNGNSLTLVSGSTYRLDISTGTVDLTDLVVGDECVLEHHVYSFHFVRMDDVGDVDIYDCEVFDAAGSAFFVAGGQRVRIHDCKVTARPGLRVKHTINSDGVHVHARNVEVFNNRIEGTGDDCVNTFSHSVQIDTVDGAKQLTCLPRNSPRPDPRPGDFIQITDVDHALIQETYIVSVDSITTNAFTITVRDTLDAAVTATGVVCLPIETSTISNNTLGLNRNRAVVGGARVLEIRDNTINRPAQLGILIPGEPAGFAASRLIRVAGNSIYRSNRRATGNRNAGVMSIDCSLDNGSRATGSPYELVVVEGNAVHDTNNGGFAIRCAEQAIVSNNVFSSLGNNPQANDGFIGGRPIMLHTIVDATIDGNRVLDASALTADGQSVTNDVVWGQNVKLEPQTGTNALSITGAKTFIDGVHVPYEEGLFTPVFTFSTPGDLSVSYTTQVGTYTRRGNRVEFSTVLAFTPTWSTSTGLARVQGLPFTSANISDIWYALNLSHYENLGLGPNDVQLGARMFRGDNQIRFSVMRDSGATVDSNTNYFPSGNSIVLMVSGSYEI